MKAREGQGVAVRGSGGVFCGGEGSAPLYGAKNASAREAAGYPRCWPQTTGKRLQVVNTGLSTQKHVGLAGLLHPKARLASTQKHVDNLSHHQPRAHRRGGGQKHHAPAVNLKPCARILPINMSKNRPEALLELVHPAEAEAELILEVHPANKLGGFDSAKTLRKPGIHVKSHRRVGERGYRPLIKWNRVTAQGFKIPRRQFNYSRPQDPLSFVFTKPEFHGVYDVSIDLIRS